MYNVMYVFAIAFPTMVSNSDKPVLMCVFIQAFDTTVQGVLLSGCQSVPLSNLYYYRLNYDALQAFAPKLLHDIVVDR